MAHPEVFLGEWFEAAESSASSFEVVTGPMPPSGENPPSTSVGGRLRHSLHSYQIPIVKPMNTDVRHISQPDCDRVWVEFLNVARSSGAPDADILQAIVEAGAKSTSSDQQNLATILGPGQGWKVDGVPLVLGDLAIIARRFASVHQPNPLRAWFRSWRDGELPHRCFGLLTEKSNVELRSKVASAAGVPVEFAHVAFDTFDEVVSVGQFSLSFEEKSVAKIALANSANRSLSEQGEVVSTRDTSTRMSKAAALPVASPLDSSVDRTGFKSVR